LKSKLQVVHSAVRRNQFAGAPGGRYDVVRSHSHG
jgi:hypothetical protein